MKKILSLLCVLFLVCGCASTPAQTSNESTSEPVVGSGVAMGRNGEVKVSVEVLDNTITKVEIDENSETVGIADQALILIPQWIVENNSTNVDMVSGATLTSAAIKNATISAIESAGVDATLFNAKPATKEAVTLEDMNCDIVVVGGGTAGLAAAIGAANQGANVIVVEKNYMTGGSGALSSARMNIIESEFVQENASDADDSWDVLKTYLEGKYAEGSDTYTIDWEYLYTNLSTMDETVQLLSSLGVGFEAKASSHGAEVIGEGSGPGFEVAMTNAATSLGVTILTNTTGTSILMENEQVAGITAISNGDNLTIHSNAVILATGGSLFDMNAVFDNYPSDSNAILYRGGSSGDTGDGQAMAKQVGAVIEEGLRIKQSGVEFDSVLRGALPSNVRPSTAKSVVVDADGNRFMNESLGGQAMADVLWQTGSKHYWLIADTANEETATALKAAYEQGLNIFYGETLEELAQAMGANSATLVETMNHYNELCDAQEDADFNKNADNLIAYTGTQGYYAYQIYGGSYGTMGGGILSDYQGRVLNEANEVIPGLYAAGEVSDGNIYGDYYVGGMSMGTFTTAGRVAGETAAEELSK